MTKTTLAADRLEAGTSVPREPVAADRPTPPRPARRPRRALGRSIADVIEQERRTK